MCYIRMQFHFLFIWKSIKTMTNDCHFKDGFRLAGHSHKKWEYPYALPALRPLQDTSKVTWGKQEGSVALLGHWVLGQGTEWMCTGDCAHEGPRCLRQAMTLNFLWVRHQRLGALLPTPNFWPR